MDATGLFALGKDLHKKVVRLEGQMMFAFDCSRSQFLPLLCSNATAALLIYRELGPQVFTRGLLVEPTFDVKVAQG